MLIWRNFTSTGSSFCTFEVVSPPQSAVVLCISPFLCAALVFLQDGLVMDLQRGCLEESVQH